MTIERLRVLQLVPVLFTGGLERVATALTVGLSRRVERVAVCTFGGEPFEPVLRAAGVEIIRMRRPKLSKPHDMLLASMSVGQALRRERPHVLHAHNPTAGVIGTMARRMTGLRDIALVTTYHGVVPHRVPRATRAMATSSDIVVGVGPTMTQALIAAGLDSTHARTIYNSVHVEAASRGEIRNEFAVPGELLVTVGRYAPEKNHLLLLDALARLAPKRPGLRALIVGIGPLEETLRSRVAELGLQDVVVLTGRRADAPKITAAADVFVLSSSSEGLPIALLEAMASGVPVVSTAVGGVGDAITDGETGLLAAAGDPVSLASAIERLLDDAALRERLTESARGFVESNCSPETMIDRYLDVYLEAVARRRSSSAGKAARVSLSRVRRTGASPSK